MSFVLSQRNIFDVKFLFSSIFITPKVMVKLIFIFFFSLLFACAFPCSALPRAALLVRMGECICIVCAVRLGVGKFTINFLILRSKYIKINKIPCYHGHLRVELSEPFSGTVQDRTRKSPCTSNTVYTTYFGRFLPSRLFIFCCH